MSRNKVKDGDDFINSVVKDFTDNAFISGIEIKKTKSSGSKHGDLDVTVTPRMRNNKEVTSIGLDGKFSLSPPKDADLEKAVKQAAQSGREIGVIVRNSSSPIIKTKVEIRLNDFIFLLLHAKEITSSQF